ncbi:hypothetical protein JCM11491_006571 [Sporobolomyces phaffii]
MSLFGATSSAPTFSFGQPSSAPPAASSGGGLFGAPAATGASGAGGGLFGGGATTPAPAPAGGSSLFSGLGGGGGAGTTAAAKPPAFSFGAAPAASSAPPASTSLFGGGAGGGGLFGGGGGSTTTTPSTGGGLFGQPQQQPQSGGLFGSTATTTTTTPGLFGTAQPPPQPQNQNPFGQSTQAAPAPSSSSSGITKQTKFQDLPDQARNLVEEMDKFIRSQGQLADDLKGKNLGSEITQTRRMFDQYSAEATTVTSLLENDSRLIASLRQDLEQSLADLSKTTVLIEGFKGGANSAKAAEAKGVALFPYEFFKRKSTELEHRVSRYRQTVEQISSVLTSPQSSLSPASILPTLKAQHASLLSLAAAVSALELDLEQLKDAYRDIWRDKTGRLVDPFRLAAAPGAGVRTVESGMRGIEIR